MVLPCVIALAVVVVEGLYYYPGSQTSALGGLGGGYGGLGGGYGGLGGGYGGQGNYASRQAYQQRYLQEWYQTRQQRNQLNKLAKQSAFSSFVNYSESFYSAIVLVENSSYKMFEINVIFLIILIPVINSRIVFAKVCYKLYVFNSIEKNLLFSL